MKAGAEISANKGIIDAVIELSDKVYIFEFKIKASSEKALKQIKDKKYYELDSALFSAPNIVFKKLRLFRSFPK